ncbi:porin [Acinetobacter larvae]|uniref:Porin domain-containing protein n=1 Tax=Acinetobacter larvae TaxID=1789224 RepID=A0A1B2LVR5_9GAMM|nr:porin [Acinetobacter larvae]AOA57042.1 hypothetical protein BFG52_00835 [Acinetobacter larvae]
MRFILQILSLYLFIHALPSQAEISLMQQDDILKTGDHFQLTTSGSLRLQALNFEHYNAANATQKYQRNGYSAASRIYLDAHYQATPNIGVLAEYETYINPAKILDWQGHYSTQDHSLDTVQAYFGVAHKDYGTLKYGKLSSIYYDVVGSKTDLWDYAPLAQPATWSSHSYYDGSAVSRKTLRYEKEIAPLTVYAAYLFKDQTNTNQEIEYKRDYGLALATDLKITPTLSWAVAWQHNKAELYAHPTAQHVQYHQNIIGSSIFYLKDPWMLGLGVGWYHNVHPSNRLDQQQHFDPAEFLNTQSYGLEYYLGYKIPIQQAGIQFIRPYIMGDRFAYRTGRQFYRQDYGLGLAIRFKYGFGFDIEHFKTKDSFNTPDMNLFRLRYEF